MAANSNPFGARATLSGKFGQVAYYGLGALASQGAEVGRLPFTIRILLENVLREAAGGSAREEDVLGLAKWKPGTTEHREFPFMPARVLTQDLTGVPAVVDLAAMRSAMARAGGDPQKINPLVPVDLVIDHSVQIDLYGTTLAFRANVEEGAVPQLGALPAAAVGAAGFPELPTGTSGHRHLPPGKPGVPF